MSAPLELSNAQPLIAREQLEQPAIQRRDRRVRVRVLDQVPPDQLIAPRRERRGQQHVVVLCAQLRRLTQPIQEMSIRALLELMQIRPPHLISASFTR